MIYSKLLKCMGFRFDNRSHLWHCSGCKVREQRRLFLCNQIFRGVQIAFLLACVFAFGCEASFDDLRPESEALIPEVPVPDDMGASQEDATTQPDAEREQDATASPDEGNNTIEDVEIASGTFEGRGSYSGSGSASIWKVGSSWEVRLGQDFEVDSVPGPVMVLTRESTLGSSIDASRGDIELGVLESDSGVSVFGLDQDPDDRLVLWVFCKPFGLEVARAQLQENE